MGTTFNDENYITIQGWMITRLGLSGNELICYALIFGFSQNRGAYNGSLAYMSEALNLSRSGTINVLRKLMDKQYIEKEDEYENNVKFCRYRCTYVTKLNGSTLFGRGVVQNVDGGSTLFAPNISKDNYIDNSIKKEGKPSKENPVGISPTPDEDDIPFSKRMGITAEGLGVRPQVIKKIDGFFKRLVFPFESDEFKRNFYVLCCTKNWRNKEISAIQKQLDKVKKYNEPFVMELIDTSIANDWKAIVYDSTDRKYEEFMRMGGRPMGGTIITPPTQHQREMMEFDEMLKNGEI
jgi:predicted transcriptional regulator